MRNILDNIPERRILTLQTTCKCQAILHIYFYGELLSVRSHLTFDDCLEMTNLLINIFSKVMLFHGPSGADNLCTTVTSLTVITLKRKLLLFAIAFMFIKSATIRG